MARLEVSRGSKVGYWPDNCSITRRHAPFEGFLMEGLDRFPKIRTMRMIVMSALKTALQG